MKTPMQKTLEQIERALNITISDEDKQHYVEKERQAIIQAYKNGAIYGMNVNGGCEWTVDDDEITEYYYNETFTP